MEKNVEDYILVGFYTKKTVMKYTKGRLYDWSK